MKNALAIRLLDLDSALWQLSAMPLQAGEVLLVLAGVHLAESLPSALLSVEERDRMRHYRLLSDRRRHLVAHALKRLVLGRLLNLPPQALQFEREAGGKPSLSQFALHFNLSHSGDWVTLAVSPDAEVGVDVEQARRDITPPWPSIFHPDEAEPKSLDDFLCAWTLKEAVGKCSGAGVTEDFSRLRLSFQDSSWTCCNGAGWWYAEHCRLRSGAHLALASASRWRSLRRIDIGPDVREALSGGPRWAAPRILYETRC